MRIVFLSLLVMSVLSAPLAQADQAAAKRPQELVLLNWAEYLSPDIVEEFEAEYQAVVRIVHFEDDHDRDRTLIQNDGIGFDLMLVDGTTIVPYVARGWLAPINTADVPNLRHIRESVRQAHKHAYEYAIPYLWGTLGIAYRSDLVPEPFTTWRQLVQPDGVLSGRLLMLRDSRDLLTPALKALGYSINTANEAELQAASELLHAQRSSVGTFGVLELDEESVLVKGDIWAAMSYSGDAVALQEHTEAIKYVIPQEGTALWVDYWTLSTHARNPELARKFLDFINRPEIAARNAQELYYPTPNLTAERHLPKEFLEDPQIYPPPEVLEKSEYYQVLPPRLSRRYGNVAHELSAR